MFGTPPIDEGIEMDETRDFYEEGSSAKRRKVSSFTTFFKSYHEFFLREVAVQKDEGYEVRDQVLARKGR